MMIKMFWMQYLDIYAEQYTPEPVNNASEAVRLD
ncbi:hypothetical protein OTSTA763_1691 [Orientia tsutsugamushi str. TA763]|nr:hypothetical protein OTSTA763_1691 [Orientia tsutsugamushi str. TA763]